MQMDGSASRFHKTPRGKIARAGLILAGKSFVVTAVTRNHSLFSTMQACTSLYFENNLSEWAIALNFSRAVGIRAVFLSIVVIVNSVSAAYICFATSSAG
jgi:hypothetical protein